VAGSRRRRRARAPFDGRGPGGQTETLGLYLYRQGFQFVNFGYASAVAYTIAAIAVLMALLNLWIGRVRT